jgi:hypothetical protein
MPWIHQLTAEQYASFSFDDFDWVVDTLSEPAAAHCQREKVPLREYEVVALKALLDGRGTAYRPKELFPDAASNRAASRRLENLRHKVEPAIPPGQGSFPAIVRGKELLRYAFRPRTGLRAALLVKATPVPTAPVCAQCGPFPELSPYNLFEPERLEAVKSLQIQWRIGHALHHISR